MLISLPIWGECSRSTTKGMLKQSKHLKGGVWVRLPYHRWPHVEGWKGDTVERSTLKILDPPFPSPVTLANLVNLYNLYV